MIGTSPAGTTGAAAAVPGIVGWLSLTATPTFAGMALLTCVPASAPADMLCAAGHGSALGGMGPMYLLMSLFHASPWLKLVFGRAWAPT
jgi:hypothetical protein